MATITKRYGKYTVRVRRLGYPSLSKTFTQRKDSELWGKQKELEIERGELPTSHRAELEGLTLGALIEKYKDTVTSTKKGKGPGWCFLSAIGRHRIASKPIADITTEDWAKNRHEPLEK
jgi:hypothetical protein